MRDLVQRCSNTKYAYRKPNTKFFQRKRCVWHCAVMIVAYNDQCGAYSTGRASFGQQPLGCNNDEPFRVDGYDGVGNVFIFPTWIVRTYVIRSSAPKDSTVTIPISINMQGYQPGAAQIANLVACNVTVNYDLVLTVGENTNSAWQSHGTFTASNGVVFSVYKATYVPGTEDPAATISEWALIRSPFPSNLASYPQGLAGDASNPCIKAPTCDVIWRPGSMVNPGPIKWRSGIAAADTYGTKLVRPAYKCIDAFGGDFEVPAISTTLSNVRVPWCGGREDVPNPFYSGPSPIDWGLTSVYCHPPLQAENVGSSPCTCILNTPALSPNARVRSFNEPIFSDPSSPRSVDDAFNINVTYRNPFTGLTVDGTHYYGDAQDCDYDTNPNIELADPKDEDSVIMDVGGGVDRLGFGSYRYNNVRFKCKAGFRRFEIWPAFVEGSFSPVTQVRKASGYIEVTPGVAAYYGFEDPQVAIGYAEPNIYKAGEVLYNPRGGPLRALIFDRVGQDLPYNIAPASSHAATFSLRDWGGNHYASPEITGTLVKVAVNGVIELTDLKVKGLGRNYSVQMNVAGLSPSGSDYYELLDIEIKCGLKYHVMGPVAAGQSISIKVDIVDADGNLLVPSTADNLTLSGGGSFTGYGSQTPVGGTATFSGSFPTAGTYLVKCKTSGTRYDGPGVNGEAEAQVMVTVV
jgi:hypothetical protein